MVQKRMPENFCFLEMSKNFQFFCAIAEKLYSRITILPKNLARVFTAALFDSYLGEIYK
jgi:hypothetical protein